MPMSKSLIGTTMFLALASATAHAEEPVARWTDASGVTHFGNPHLGPADAEVVDVAPANGMVAPALGASPAASGGPRFVRIDKQPNRETIGFRGHDWTVKRNRRSRR